MKMNNRNTVAMTYLYLEITAASLLPPFLSFLSIAFPLFMVRHNWDGLIVM